MTQQGGREKGTGMGERTDRVNTKTNEEGKLRTQKITQTTTQCEWSERLLPDHEK